MEDDFNELERTINAMVEGLSPKNRTTANRIIAKKLAQINQKRIKAQTEPSGEKFIPRTKKKLFTPDTVAKFLYPSHGSGKPRVVKLTSWTLTNDIYTGHDKYSGGQLKSFARSKIIKFLRDDESAEGHTSEIKTRFKANRIKNKMFKNLATSKYLKQKYNPDEINVGFLDASPSRIARIHNYGESEIISKRNNKSIKMPKRTLIGITPDDELMIIEEISKLIDYADI